MNPLAAYAKQVTSALPQRNDAEAEIRKRRRAAYTRRMQEVLRPAQLAYDDWPDEFWDALWHEYEGELRDAMPDELRSEIYRERRDEIDDH